MRPYGSVSASLMALEETWKRVLTNGGSVGGRPGRVKTRVPAETNVYLVILRKAFVQRATNCVEDFSRHRERQRDGLAGAAQFERLHHQLSARVGPGLHLRQPHEPANDVAKVVGGLVVARFGANGRPQSAVDVAAHSKQRDGWQTAGDGVG